MTTPAVSVLVLNHDGREHLAECLPTLEAQIYPKAFLDIVVIDNGSKDDSVAFVRRQHPRVRVIGFGHNRGFAAAYNDAVRQCDSPLVAFLNNDTRVAPDWLAELAGALERHGARCAGSRILDWTGERIDFGGSIVSFIGHSWHRDAGLPASTVHREEPLLFACGGSMIINRDIFLEAGGFDEAFFAYFEDVDLGWRLNLLGHPVVFAPRAVTYHKAHGTAGRIARAQRLRLYERNALAMIYKNYSDDTLVRVAPAAVVLAVARGLADLGIDTARYALGRRPPESEDISARTIAHLIALEEFGMNIAELDAKRRAIQARRRLSDQALWPLFGDPFKLHETGGAYERIARTVIADFGIDKLIGDRAQPSGPSAPVGDGTVPPVLLLPVSVGAPGAVDAPTVSIVILTVMGALHLTECLESIAAQRYPRGRCEVIVVDNGSSEDPTAAVGRAYPGARVIRTGANLGFARGNNVGARSATGEYVLFLNDDTRVHADWLAELVAVAVRHQAACVGCRILSWDGELIDFCGGSVNFEGRGFQHHIGERATDTPGREAPMLFACGAAMMVARDIFLDAGALDEGTFIYYEDVELGWRLWLFGYEVWFAPRSIVYHKHHGTTGSWAEPPRLRLYEHNALRMLYTQLEDATLARVLPAALLLAADRALLGTTVHRGFDERRRWKAGFLHGWTRPILWLRHRARPRRVLWLLRHAVSRHGARKNLSLLANLRVLGVAGAIGAAAYVVKEILAGSLGDESSRGVYLIEHGGQPGSFDAHTERVTSRTAAMLLGLFDFVENLPAISTRRATLQARRRRTDAEILSQFDDWWLSPMQSARQLDHNDLQAALVKAFDVPTFNTSTGPRG